MTTIVLAPCGLQISIAFMGGRRERERKQTIAMAIVSDLVMGMEPGLMAMRTPERIMIVRTRVS